MYTQIQEMQQRATEHHKTSTRYQYVDTVELLQSIQKVLGKQQYQTKIIHGSGKSSKHTVQITLGDSTKIAGDDCRPRLLLTNSFNGESALRINVGLLRLACSNGLVVGDKMFSDSVIHLKDEATPERLERLSDHIYSAVDWLKHQVDDRIKPMLTPFDEGKEIEVMLKLKDDKTLSNRRFEKTMDRLARRPFLRVADQQRNAWTLYNIVNEVIKDTSKSEAGYFSQDIGLMDRIIELSYD